MSTISLRLRWIAVTSDGPREATDRVRFRELTIMSSLLPMYTSARSSPSWSVSGAPAVPAMRKGATAAGLKSTTCADVGDVQTLAKRAFRAMMSSTAELTVFCTVLIDRQSKEECCGTTWTLRNPHYQRQV
eukprot:TRINITY_DN21341_c0_g1_i3.p2 TRINITY_DN21341_c0_g1~~TRINITY_DN21341_c0_g1_i3.p2  ORF type:complete len:131 (+),score=12.03 TRINITY_DN21341_c0_g1_i3:395-787(+)